MIRLNMDADNTGSWAPIVVAIILLSLAGWGLWSIPKNEPTLEGNSENSVPHFVEHFPTGMGNEVPDDDVIRIAWHPEESELGTLKTDERYLELGELSVVEHVSQPANASLHTSIQWSSEATLNITVHVNLTTQIENGILRLILIEDTVEMFGRTPDQHAVVRLYDPNPIGEGNGTINRELTLTNGLTEEDAGRLQLVVMLSDMMTEENHALMSMPIPVANNGPTETGQRVSTLMGLVLIIFSLTTIVRAEWKREVMLPKLRGGRDRRGKPVAYLKAGRRDLHLREVRVLEPWKLEKKVREIDLPAGEEKTIPIQVKPIRGENDVQTSIIQTEWSIEVDEMGRWVLDLTLYKEPPT